MLAGEALGRSRGGWTTKIVVAGEGKGRPLALVVVAGQEHESTHLEPVLDAIRVPRHRREQVGLRGPGRPRKRPDRLLTDKGFSYLRCRAALRRRGIPHLIPERWDQRAKRQQRGRQGGRPCFYAPEVYRERNRIERLINRLKCWRRIATRYEKRAANYQAFLQIASIMLWL